MCGIAGYFGKGDKTVLKKMVDQFIYRGPDDEGFYIDEKCGLGHRRLSIMDLSSSGHQPMANEDKTVWIAFNGEIYNFKDLKNSLRDKHQFIGQSDTEVILHLYEELGEDVFSKLMGMFSIAIYDRINQKIILARDRIGKKPLYYGIFDNTLLFGSELKVLLKHPECKRELDIRSLNMYLQYEYVPTPYSIFKNIYKLEPGSYLTYDGSHLNKKFFWDIAFNNLQINSKYNQKISMIDAIGELDYRLNKAVNDRMVSDVPLGIFLSGGIDSSTIAYYAQKNSQQKIKTFSISFSEISFDESKYARQVAKYLHTEHYERSVSSQDSLDAIHRIIKLLDEPMADASIIPTFLLAEFTKQHVTVALGGDGGDESLYGYDTFVAHRLAEYYEKLPSVIRKNIIEKIIYKLPTSFNNISFDFKLKKFISGFEGEKKYRNFIWLGSFDREQRRKILTSKVWQRLGKENEFEVVDNYLLRVKNENYLNQLVYLYFRTYLMDDILVKVDRASMYNSLEVRAPFLDTDVVDFINYLPSDYKMHNLTTKYILKKLMHGRLPDRIINRKKKGFGVPLAKWMNKDLKPLLLEIFEKNKIEQQGLFDYQYINKIFNDHFSRRADNHKLIWTLLIFQMWCQEWLSE
jgi:asparagine synthase (glutamine-hydrolysing)